MNKQITDDGDTEWRDIHDLLDEISRLRADLAELRKPKTEKENDNVNDVF